MIGSINRPDGIRPFRFGAGIGAIGGDTYRQAVVNTGPVSYWRLGEASGTNAADEMGANAGTYSGAPTLGAPGLLVGDSNTAMVTTGAGVEFPQHLNCGSAIGNLTSGVLPFTIAVWINCTPDGNYRNFLSTLTTDHGIQAYSQNGEIGWKRVTAAGNDGINRASGLSAGSHLVVLAYTGTEMQLDIDGSSAAAPVASTRSIGTGLELWFGAQPAGWSWGYAGTIDEPAVWNRALAPAEIAMLNAIGRGTW